VAIETLRKQLEMADRETAYWQVLRKQTQKELARVENKLRISKGNARAIRSVIREQEDAQWRAKSTEQTT
jgi:hypothetical protein